MQWHFLAPRMQRLAAAVCQCANLSIIAVNAQAMLWWGGGAPAVLLLGLLRVLSTQVLDHYCSSKLLVYFPTVPVLETFCFRLQFPLPIIDALSFFVFCELLIDINGCSLRLAD